MLKYDEDSREFDFVVKHRPGMLQGHVDAGLQKNLMTAALQMECGVITEVKLGEGLEACTSFYIFRCGLKQPKFHRLELSSISDKASFPILLMHQRSPTDCTQQFATRDDTDRTNTNRKSLAASP